jgi:MarR family transcriptional regulator, lower aerobic nicotinate degradation pathway regulator
MIDNRYDFLQSLLKQVEIYENEKRQVEHLEMADFAQWLAIKTNSNIAQQTQGGAEAGLGELVASMYRYAKLYSKKAMEGTPLSSTDDFGYLINLFVHGEMSKTDLIAHNIHEKPTGMEIIKRLIKQGFLSQLDDPTDGRSLLVNITDSGRQVLFQLLGQMRKVETIAQGKLNQQEQASLLYLLRKLHIFHNKIYKTEKNIDLDLILEKYIN